MATSGEQAPPPLSQNGPTEGTGLHDDQQQPKASQADQTQISEQETKAKYQLLDGQTGKRFRYIQVQDPKGFWTVTTDYAPS